MSLKENYKDEILEAGQSRTYNMVGSNGGVLYSNVKLEKAYTPKQKGDNFGADDINQITKAINGIIDLIYPVGSQIYNANKEFNPSKYYPNTTWVRIKGYVLAGINENDTDTTANTTFNKKAGEKIGSKWLHKHSHQQYVAANEQGDVYRRRDYSGEGNAGIFPQNVSTDMAGSGDGQNIQPTQLTYIWERTK